MNQWYRCREGDETRREKGEQKTPGGYSRVLSKHFRAYVQQINPTIILNSSVARPGLVHITRAMTLANRKNRPITITFATVDGYASCSRGSVPSVGLGTWGVSGEDAEKAVKVTSEESFDQRNPNS